MQQDASCGPNGNALASLTQQFNQDRSLYQVITVLYNTNLFHNDVMMIDAASNF